MFVQVRNEMQQCNTLSLDLEKENARRTKWETTADQERKKREEGDKALHEAAKTVARLEAALAEARDGAAAAAREREEAEARLATELVKVSAEMALRSVFVEVSRNLSHFGGRVVRFLMVDEKRLIRS